MTLLRSSWTDRALTDHSFSVAKQEIVDNGYKLFLNAYTVRKSPSSFRTLDQLCEELLIGATPSRTNYQAFRGDVPWAKVGDLSGRNLTETEEYITEAAATELGSRRQVPAGTLLMSFKLSIGKTAISGTPMYTNEAIAALRLRPEYDNDAVRRYLYYVLPLIDYRPFAQRATKGLTLNQESLKRVEVPFPDDAERDALLARFDRIEAERDARMAELAALRAQQSEIAVELYS